MRANTNFVVIAKSPNAERIAEECTLKSWANQVCKRYQDHANANKTGVSYRVESVFDIPPTVR